MKKIHWSVIWGSAFLIAALVIYTAHSWYGTSNEPRVFLISFLVAAVVILLGQTMGRRKPG